MDEVTLRLSTEEAEIVRDALGSMSVYTLVNLGHDGADLATAWTKVRDALAEPI